MIYLVYLWCMCINLFGHMGAAESTVQLERFSVFTHQTDSQQNQFLFIQQLCLCAPQYYSVSGAEGFISFCWNSAACTQFSR